MQENDPLKSNNHDDQPPIDSEQNDQQQTNPEQEKQTQDTPPEQPSEPSKSTNLPAWLRTEVGVSPEEQEKQTQSTSQEQPSESLMSANRIAWSREEVGTLPEQRPMRTYSYEPAPERGGCLTAWLVFLGIGSALSIVLALIAFGYSSGVVGALLLIGGVLSFVGVSGTWRFKRWGYYLLMTLSGISIASSILSLCAGSGTPTTGGSIVGAILGMFILYLLVREKWSAFE